MQSKIIISIVFLFSLVTFAFSGELFHQSYDWETVPNMHELAQEERQIPAIVLKDIRTVDYYFDEQYQTLMQYYTVHNRVRVNNDESIEYYNKEYISMSGVVDIVDVRARVITDGGVKELDEIDLKDFDGFGDYGSFKYFAIDGVEAGSEIEYIYTLKMRAKLEGTKEVFQSREPRKNVEFHLYAPRDMFFRSKGYNGFPNLILDSAVSAKNHYHSVISEIESLEEEPYASYNNQLMRLEYKLDHMAPADQVQLYTYEQLSAQLHEYFKTPLEKKESREIRNVLKVLSLEEKDLHGRIRTIEDYLKRNFTVVDHTVGEMNLDEILKKKQCTERGLIRLYMALFDTSDIKYFYGLTSDRSNTYFDPEFESYNYLENYLFYFPEINAYMAPTEFLLRLGYVPYLWTNNYGLFIRDIQVGQMSTGLGEVMLIEPLTDRDNLDKLDIEIEFGDSFDAINMNITRTLTGYPAAVVQPIYELIPEKERSLVAVELLNMTGLDVTLNHVNIRNISPDSIFVRPFVIEADISTGSAFFNKAGESYLFRVGEVIGEQVEMYQQSERQLPIENDYNRRYERTIVFKIPEGYELQNLEDLNMNINYKEGDDVSMAFKSEYKINGREVRVSIEEYYRKLTYPVEVFENFREVINAAADFNKKVLIFKKA